MEKAYIILAHKSPKQLLKLITRLNDGKSEFFLHIDKKVDLGAFKFVIEYSSRVHLVKRVTTNWGEMGLVSATLNALQAVQDYKSFDRITLLSGQDYPVKSNVYINHFFQSSPYSIFIDYTTIPDYDRWKNAGGMYRVNKYFFGLKTYQRYTAKAMNFGSMILPVLKRKIPKGIKAYAGAQWWTIDGYALNYILNYVKNNPGYTNYHKHTFAPDEIYFQSILLNSSDPKIKQSITNNNLMFSKWAHASSAHPEVLQENNLEEILASDSLFARKFDQEVSSEMFDLLDKHVNVLVK